MRSLILAFAAAFTLSACGGKAAEGEACSADDDCDEGLVCDIPTDAEEGTCMAEAGDDTDAAA